MQLQAQNLAVLVERLRETISQSTRSDQSPSVYGGQRGTVKQLSSSSLRTNISKGKSEHCHKLMQLIVPDVISIDQRFSSCSVEKERPPFGILITEPVISDVNVDRATQNACFLA